MEKQSESDSIHIALHEKKDNSTELYHRVEGRGVVSNVARQIARGTPT